VLVSLGLEKCFQNDGMTLLKNLRRMMTVAMIRYQVVEIYLGLLSKRLNGIFYQMILCTFYDLGSVADLDEPSEDAVSRTVPLVGAHAPR
jgi:hypothetical protein